MGILWWRILAVALVLEMLYGAFVYTILGAAEQALAPVGLVSVFLFMLAGGAAIAWMAPSRKILQGSLVGIAAIALYTLITIPAMSSGELVLTAGYLINHLCKLLGAAAGSLIGVALSRRTTVPAG